MITSDQTGTLHCKAHSRSRQRPGRKGNWRLGLRLLAISLCLAAGPVGGRGVELVRNGEGAALIVLPNQPDQPEQQAARELQSHIRLISGAELAIVDQLPENQPAIILGQAAPEDFLHQLQQQTKIGDAFRIRVDNQQVTVAGLTSRGTLNGAYELLEQLGVRWFVPDQIGTVFEARENLTIANLDEIFIPSFSGRHLIGAPRGHAGQNEWARRLKLGGFNAGRHGQIDRHVRQIEDGRETSQAMVSDPETLRRTVETWHQRLLNGQYAEHEGVRYISLGPEDGHGYGEDDWDAGDMDPLHGRISVTDRYIKFFNLVIEELEKRGTKMSASHSTATRSTCGRRSGKNRIPTFCRCWPRSMSAAFTRSIIRNAGNASIFGRLSTTGRLSVPG